MGANLWSHFVLDKKVEKHEFLPDSGCIRQHTFIQEKLMLILSLIKDTPLLQGFKSNELIDINDFLSSRRPMGCFQTPLID